MDRLNDFYEEFQEKQKIAIGQTFMISSKEIWKWAKTYDSDEIDGNNTFFIYDITA